MTKELKKEIKLLLAALITALAIAGAYFALTIEEKISSAFENGYEQAILDAELTSVTESGYTISFNGEEHYYSFS